MWMPEWLYERLPLLYLAAGGTCLWFLGTAVTMSAFLLSAAALITYIQRRSARKSASLRASSSTKTMSVRTGSKRFIAGNGRLRYSSSAKAL